MPSDSKPPSPFTESQTAEADMRQALGLGARNNGHARRFGQERNVPVTVLRTRRDGTREETDAALLSEREARTRAEAALATAQKTIRDLQTKLAHVEMTQDDLRAALRKSDDQRQAIERTETEHQRARKAAEMRLDQEAADRKTAEQQLNALRRETARPAVPESRKTRAAAPQTVGEQAPVDWWSKHERK